MSSVDITSGSRTVPTRTEYRDGDSRKQEKSRRMAQPWLLPLAFFVIASTLSASFSWSVSYWNDEAITVSAGERSLPQLWAMLQNVDAVHGLYYSFMHFWMLAFGDTEFIMRLPSAMAAGATAAGVVVLTRRLSDERTAVIAGVAAVTLPRLTWAGIEARPYAFTAAIAVWCAIALSSALAKGAIWRWMLYSLAAGAGILLNIYLALFVVAQGVTVLLLHGLSRRMAAFTVAAVSAGGIGSVALIAAAGQTGQLGTLGERNPIGLLRLMGLNELFLGETPSADAVSPAFDLAWRIAGIVLAVLGLGLLVVAVLRRRRATGAAQSGVIAYTLPWLILPPLIVGLYTVAVGPLFQARYFTFAAPAAAILIGAGFRALRHRQVRWAVATIWFCAASIVFASQRVPTAKAGSDWAAAAEFLSTSSSRGDAVYFTPRYPAHAGTATWTARRMAYGYAADFSKLDDLTLRVSGPNAGTLDGESDTLADVLPALKSHDTVWVVYSPKYFPAVIRSDREVLVNAGYSATLRRSGPGSVIVKYQRQVD